MLALPPSFTFAQARTAGVSERALRALVERGELERFGRGLYRQTDAPVIDLDLVEIALRTPEATICLTSALAHHELSDALPSEIDVALPRARRPPRVGAPVRWHRFHTGTFSVGRSLLRIEDELDIGLYDPARCVIDAFRLRHLLGDEVAPEALRRWLSRRDSFPSKLLDMARSFPKCERPLLDALRILL